MTPAAELHAAAALLREEATAAYGELCLPPWRYGNSWAGTHAVLCQEGHPIAVFGVDVGGVPGPAAGLAEAQARYAATVHPGVGLLLADLLDRAAQRAEVVYETAIDEIAVEPHLAVARAILGDTDARRPA
jgi:hypothetical protein